MSVESGVRSEAIEQMMDAQGAASNPGDLAQLVEAFGEVSMRLEATHERLRGEVRRLKRQLRDADEELQRSRRLAALGEMAAGIAHEVRNPLGSIRLYAALLEEDLIDRPEQKQTAGRIRQAVCGLDAVVGDVLAFSREMRVRIAPVDLEDLVSGVVDACRADLVAPVAARFGEDAQSLHGDASLLHRALVNLVRNASDAMRGAGIEDGEIVVESCRELEACDEHDEVAWRCLRVRDTGTGVSPEVVERMFNPFFTTRDAGTGLGLPIVNRIVDAHGGRVRVWNNADRTPGEPGATVELRLPDRAGRVEDDGVVGVVEMGGAVRRPGQKQSGAAA